MALYIIIYTTIYIITTALSSPIYRFDECVTGGEILIVDLFTVAEELREKHPKHFQILTEVPYTVQRIHRSLQ